MSETNQGTRCDCDGCRLLGQGVCGCFECSECGATSATPIETLDIACRGGAYRPCAECLRKAEERRAEHNERLRARGIWVPA